MVSPPSKQSASGVSSPIFELTGDQAVDGADIDAWVSELFHTWLGDVDLDGRFDSSDIVTLLASGTYETEVAAVWSTGDFDGDGRCTSADLIHALADGGYEQGPRTATKAVPEPGNALLLAIGSALLYQAIRRSRLKSTFARSAVPLRPLRTLRLKQMWKSAASAESA